MSDLDKLSLPTRTPRKYPRPRPLSARLPDLRVAMVHYRALFEDLLNLGVSRQQSIARKEIRHEA